jgi:hypothetical protein
MVPPPRPIGLEVDRSSRAIVTLLCLLGAGAPASAQSLKVPTIVFAGAALADWSTTHYNLSHGHHEANPMLWWLNDKPGPTVVIGASIDVAGVWLVNRYLGRRHPKLTAIGLYLSAGVRLALSVDNFTHRQARRSAPPLP